MQRRSETVTVTTAYTEVLSHNSLDADEYLMKMAVELTNTGASQAISAFKIQLKVHPQAAWYDWLEDTDLQDVTDLRVLECSTLLPHALTAGQIANFAVAMPPVYAMRLMAQTAANDTTVRARASIR